MNLVIHLWQLDRSFICRRTLFNRYRFDDYQVTNVINVFRFFLDFNQVR
jgi:hypothetical protein